MLETPTIRPTSRTIYPGDPSEADGNQVQHVDPAKSILSRIVGRAIWPGREGEPAKQAPPRPQIPPAQELAQLEARLPHLESQLAAANAILEADPRPYATAPQAVRNVSNTYRAQLASGADVAAMPLVDVPLLRDVLHTVDSAGLLDLTQARIYQLRELLRVPEAPKGQHRKLIQAAETALRNFGLAYRALREFEGKTGSVGQRHTFRAPRPSFGPAWGQLSEQELRRVAEFGEAMPVDPK